MLNKLKTYRKQSEEGFTLIELLVVIIIIGILAAIAIPIFMNQQKAGLEAALKTDLHNMAIATQTWFAKYPQKTHMSEGTAGTVMGWAVVQHGSDDARFAGTVGNAALADKEVVPEGFPEVSVSAGNSVAVVSGMGYNREFCVAGNAIGTDYETVNNMSPKLYWDSKYGLVVRADIPADGACKSYI